MSFAGISAGIAGVSTIGKIVSGFHQEHLANQINPQYTPYQSSPYAAKQLGTAQQLFNGRMFGAADQEQNIATSQSNYGATIDRNATDSGQALALGGLSQGVADNAYNQLGIEEQQNKYNLLNNLNAGYTAMTNEGDKVYQDKLQKYSIDSQQKAALRSAGYQNIFSGLNDAASGAVQYGQLTGMLPNTKTTN